MPEIILCVNVGSSSLRFGCFDIGGAEPAELCSGGHDSNADTGDVQVSFGGESRGLGCPEPADHAAVARRLVEMARAELGGLAAVAHRVLHGGPRFADPVAIAPGVLDYLESLAPFGPLHQKANLLPARALAEAEPGLPQVAVFDCAFHRTLPETKRLLPLPLDIAAEGGLRRYGFHGLSYQSVAARMAALSPARRILAVHLGGGASLCAMRDGASVATTMSTTPLDGAMMATRCGALDPGVVLWLLAERGMSVGEVSDLLWRRSGLAGVSGISGDLRDLLPSADPAARRAVRLYCASLVREAGAMIAAMGGIDALVFTGGAGAGQPEIRERVCDGLGWFGLALDIGANRAAGSGSRISASASAVEAWVMEPDEERTIAAEAARVLHAANGGL